MIPSILSSQLKRGLKDYIDTTFQITTPLFKNAVTDLLEEPNKVFREPYVSVKLPFRTSYGSKKWFEGVNLKFPPYAHQEKAFERLNSNMPKSTLVATGTGSGKTECFLYPILEYCYKHRGEPGIKAILIYPMNALATDQARRLAKLINENSDLKGNIRAGMFVGDKEENPSRSMSSDKIITDRDTLKEYPPDILLTNYKMLDYLLVRPDDAKLWKDNNFHSLKFIVVDELHTFDGAQGTDLAVLLRRLKSRLFTPDNYLCCVGTSATMGSKEHGEALRKYASDIFGEDFDEKSIITEDRLSSLEFFDDIDIDYFDIPTKEALNPLSEIVDGKFDEVEYIKLSANAWFNKSYDREFIKSKEFRVNLSEDLKKCKFFRDIVESLDSKSMEYTYIKEKLRSFYPEFKSDDNYFISLVDSILALTSYAKLDGGSGDSMTPFLQVNIQVWIRELKRMVAKVSKDISLEMSDDLNDEQKKYYLPPINCRSCGATGWVTMEDANNSIEVSDLSMLYTGYFNNDPDIRMIFPMSDGDNYTENVYHICPKCMSRRINGGSDKCSNCGHEGVIKAYVPNLTPSTVKRGATNGYNCPCCGNTSGLSLIGVQSTTLISAGISEIFASKFNDDKKLLTFSDSVQDASHKTGFFNARTWKFNLREAMQKFALDGGEGLSIKDFASKFNEYWINKMGLETYISTFISPDMTWKRAFEEMVSTGVLDKEDEAVIKLVDDIRKRVEIEIYYEYGFSSRVGRSLEKSSASTIAPNIDVFEKVTDNIYERVINEVGEVRNISKDDMKQIVYGVILKLKNSGAIYKDAIREYIYKEGNSYMISKKRYNWMPGMSIVRKPQFVNINASKISNDYDVISKNSWYYKWMEKSLRASKDIGTLLMRLDMPIDVYNIMFEELEKSSVLFKAESHKKNKMIGLNDTAINIDNDTEQLKCSHCGHTISTSKKYSKYSIGMRCMRNECSGSYEFFRDDLDFYGKLYTNGDICRIYAKEHTGLLERDDRESVENEFKKSKEDQKPWDTNILSCTPTLEMGIDIGDLSTVVLCSVPPGQAQYQQRIGRAGRRDGNALNIVVANSRPHDLYFYEDPAEMISTVVDPPAIFLDASAVLERQFIGYCFDCWIKSGATSSEIPHTLSKVLSSFNTDKTLFPYNYLTYVQNNLSWIFPQFVGVFKGKLSEESQEQLRKFVYGDGTKESPLNCKVVDAFIDIDKQRESIKKDMRRLTADIRKLESKVQDSSLEEEKKQLIREKAALSKVVESINDKNIFNFLSEEGLLPNYAFPEAGVTLKAVIYRKREEDHNTSDEKQKKYDTFLYEYTRPAMSAIGELAPTSSFYAGGRKLTIDQVDVKVTEPEYWRLCPSCSHAELEVTGKNVAQCPHCGDPTWTDSGQVKEMLKLKVVYSNDEYAESKSADESDERETKFYCKQMLVDVDAENDITNAYMVEEANNPFGFEFIQKATLREINFGEMDNIGDKISVAGRREVRKGFKICKYCGKIQTEDKKDNHTFTCPAKKKVMNDAINECLYLYREFTSEAIRILIPSTSLDSSQSRLQSFVASLMLGLKKHFGSVEHLKVCVCEEPIKNSSLRKNYLVLYDTVPGGTGYLKQLMKSKEPIMDILQKALDEIKACSCGSNGKKGCYRCLFAYKQSRFIGEISSQVAIEMLNDILKDRNKLKEIKSINDIPVNSLFDSELERKFIEALSRSSKADRKISVTQQMVKGKPGYRLEIGEKIWEVEPQVCLGPNEGVKISCKPDFVLWPVRNTDEDIIKPIAIFTDGYMYHKDIIGNDMAKRIAISNSGNFYIWSLTWKDIEDVFNRQGNYYTNYLNPDKLPLGNKFTTLTNQYNISNLRINEKSSFEFLLDYLVNPDRVVDFTKLTFVYTMCMLNLASAKDKAIFETWKEELEINTRINNLIDYYKSNIATICGQLKTEYLDIDTCITIEDMKKQLFDTPLVVAILDDMEEHRDEDFEKHWNGFLNAYNLFQFNPVSLFMTKTGIHNRMYDSIINDFIDRMESSDKEENLFDESCNEVIEICDETCHELLELLANENIPCPGEDSVGHELINEDEEVIAMAEIVWEDKKVAIITREQEEFKEAYIEYGWTVFNCENYNIDEVKSKLS